MNQVFNYKWNLKDGYPSNGVENHKSKVFSTFACGGGSTMGYKLAGYDVIGANDIDPKMAEIYKINHNPKHYFLESIVDLTNRNDLPDELFDLDILDGSPPCSTFSMSGSRENAWKKDKKFREGQAKQVLSDLFFEWIKLVNKLKPKIAIAENVKGMLIGNAKAYTQLIVKELNKIGYDVQVFLLNAASMGVPQKRERVFFICSRKKLKSTKLKFHFDERPITIKEAISDMPNYSEDGIKLTQTARIIWEKTKTGDSAAKVKNGSWFSRIKLNPNKVCNTITAKSQSDLWHWEKPYYISGKYLRRLSTFPNDYSCPESNIGYIVGMSVPPVMIAQISYQIYKQWIEPYSVKRNGEECKDFESD